jgi:hypothetical protein
MKKVMIVTTTVTFANKGADILKRQNISAEVKKAGGGTAMGCLYGITINAGDYNEAVNLLNEGGIRIISVKEIVT